MYNQKYYWYIAPRNSTGATKGCTIDSFTTAPAPINCIPLTTRGCANNDTLKLVQLTGENGTSINNPSGCSQDGYSNHTSSSNVTLAAGRAYSGIFHTSFVHDYISIWIDFNNDGYYSANERILNNLKQQWSGLPTPFTINIPGSAATGVHTMRVRNVYYSVNPAVGSRFTDPCNDYTYSETEDYRVTIIPSAQVPTPTVARVAPNTCTQVGYLTVDNWTNNNTRVLNIVNENNNLVATLNANGNDLGIVDVHVFENNGTIRTMSNGTKLLDRNITIRPQFQPTTPISLRLYITEQELAALKMADPTVTGRSSLMVTKTTDSCLNAQLPITGVQVIPSFDGPFGQDHFIDLSLSSFSSFFIHSRSSVLPVSIVSFTGERQGSLNNLKWNTATEINSSGFEVERSFDGINFTRIGYVPAKTETGNSNSLLTYEYHDKRRIPGNNYYRLRQIDRDGTSKLSHIVLLKGKQDFLSISNLYPNPAKEKINVIVATPLNQKLSIVITDAAGKTIRQQQTETIAGENIFSVSTNKLAPGTYLLRILCTDSCETVSTRFIKE
jgi:hypothetical protein